MEWKEKDRMKLTVKQLKRIIKEEITKIGENTWDSYYERLAAGPDIDDSIACLDCEGEGCSTCDGTGLPPSEPDPNAWQDGHSCIECGGPLDDRDECPTCYPEDRQDLNYEPFDLPSNDWKK